MDQSKVWRLPWGVVVLFLGLPLLAFPELIWSQQTLYRTDISWIHYPGHIFMAAEWLAGRVPLWDPYRQAGVPMLAEPQIGVLYPLRVLFLSPLSPSLELSLFLLLHFALAAYFTFSLARFLGQSTPAATLAGLSFGLGGFLMAQLSNVNIFSAAVWLPLTLLGLMWALERRSWLAALVAGLPLILLILTAHSQITFYTLLVLVSYGLYQLTVDLFFRAATARVKLRSGLNTASRLLVAIGSGLLLAAPQLLPTIELLPLTLRSQDQGLELLTENSLHPLLWLNLILPSAFGNNVVKFKTGDPFQEVFIYVGFIPLVLALISLLQLRRSPSKPKLFFALLFLGASLLALGRFTPLYEYLIQYLPGFDLFRIPARWLMVVNLALAVLAGFGYDQVLEHRLSRRVWLGLALTGAALAVAVGLTWVFRANLLGWSAGLSDASGKLITALLNKSFTVDQVYQDRLLLGWFFGLNTPAYLLTANLLLTAGLLTLWQSRRLSPRLFSLFVIAVTSVDLILAGGTGINPIRPGQRWQRLSGGARYVLEHMEGQRVFPLGVSGEDESVRNFGQYFPSVYRIRSAGGYASPLKLARYERFLNEAHPVQALQVLGVRFILSRGQMGADVAATYPPVFQDEESVVYENKNPLARIFITPQAIQAGSAEQALSYFKGLELDPVQTVILEAETTAPRLPPAPETFSGSVTILSDTPQLIEVMTHSSAAAYLVLLDTFYPGWVARIDGQPTPIYRANYLMRAVYLPGGNHTVRFEYQPASFRWGLGLAGLTLLLFVSVFLKVQLHPS